MPMKVRADVFRDELDQIILRMTEWKNRLKEGIPGDDLPSTEMNAEIFQTQLHNELGLCASRIISLCEAIE